MKYKQKREASSFSHFWLYFPINEMWCVRVRLFGTNRTMNFYLYDDTAEQLHKIVISNGIDIWWTFWLLNNEQGQ